MNAVPASVVRDSPAGRWRLAVALWSVGFVGIVLVTVQMLPVMLARIGVPLPMPLWVLGALSVLQSGVLLGLAVWGGCALAPRVGLRAPGFEAWAARGDVAAALRPQWRPGLLAGAVGGVLLAALPWLPPPALVRAGAELTPGLAARLLYGGITEELLLRWGMMTVLVWIGWRVLQRGRGAPSALVDGGAIAISAVLFGVGHLPAAHQMLGGLDAATVAYVIGANTVFGLLFGALYRRHGLESAMLAHAGTHLVAWSLALLAR